MNPPASRQVSTEEHPSLSHLSAWTYIALVVVAISLAASLFYFLSTCYTTASRANPPLPSESKKYLRYSQESLIQPLERAHTLDANLIPFYEPFRPPICTKVAPSDPKLTPVLGPGIVMQSLPYGNEPPKKKSFYSGESLRSKLPNWRL